MKASRDPLPGPSESKGWIIKGGKPFVELRKGERLIGASVEEICTKVSNILN